MNRSQTVHRSILRALAVAGAIVLISGGFTTALAQTETETEPAAEEGGAPPPGWSNETELSLVVTQGNSDTSTFGFKSITLRRWLESLYTLRLEAVRSDTADSRYAVVDPDAPDGFDVVTPDATLDVDKALIENTFHRAITERFGWNVGLTWDRNKDAGIRRRWVAFAGVGNLWWDREDLMFRTDYGLSYTDREDITPDPESDDSFAGLRVHWTYMNRIGKVTTLTHNFTVNSNLSELSDYYFDTTTGLGVAMNSRLALRVSIQFLYNNIPSLEEIDLFLDPGQTVKLRTVEVPNKKLDTIFNTSLVVSF